MTIEGYRAKFNKCLGKKEVLEQENSLYTDKVKFLSERKECIELAQVFIQKVAQDTQNQLKVHIEDIVRMAMNSVYSDLYDFKVDFSIERNKTVANLVFTKDGHEISILDASGGGICDVASLGLRMATWSLGNSRPVIVLDEAMKFVSRDLQPRVGELLKEMCDKLGLQIILVTHSPELVEKADRVFVVKQKNGISEVVVAE